MASLSNDNILDVLCRVGVKDLLRFRSISKAWCSSIDDPYFIKLHLSHSLETNSNLYLNFGNNGHRFVDFVSLETARLEVPEKFDQRSMEIFGSCNGLMALYDANNDKISLWNPSTRKSKMLPPSKMEIPPGTIHWNTNLFGLGYDPMSDDYKLVRIVQFFGIDYPPCSDVKVYSLRTNSWKRIKGLPFDVNTNTGMNDRGAFGVLANDALHWLACEKLRSTSDTQTFIGTFDLGTEEYRIVELPSCLDKGFCVEMKALGGCLCLNTNYGERDVFDIWMMKEYGIKASWTKLISVKRSEFVSPFKFIIGFKFVSPLAFSRNGDKILLSIDDRKVVWYDMSSKSIDNLSINGLPPTWLHVEMLVQSLVIPLHDKNAAVINKKQRGKKNKRKKNSKRR